MSKQTADDQNLNTEPAAEEAGPDSDRPDNVRPMDQAKKKVAAAVDQARDRFQHVAADVGERFQQASATAQDEFRERSQYAREQARERYKVAAAQVQDGYSRVRKDVDYVVDDVNDFVRHKPGTSILIAAGAGFLLGLLFRPRGYRD